MLPAKHGTLLLPGRKLVYSPHGMLTWYPLLPRINISHSRLIASAYTQGISKSVYRSWETRADAFCAFQLALVLGAVRLLPSP